MLDLIHGIKMNKIKNIALGLGGLLLPALARAEGAASTIDVSKASEAATTIQTTLTGFFKDTLSPVVVAVGGAALAVYLILVVFKWARKLGK